MPVDQSRYRDLVSRAAFNCEFWRGHWQDAQRVMTAVGAPTWARMGGLPTLKQSAAGAGATSGAVPAIVNVTGAFSVEWCGIPMLADVQTDTLISQIGATGGFGFAWDSVNAVFVLSLYDAAGVLARSITTPAASAVVQNLTHVIITSSAGGTAGTATIRGVPRVVTLAGAGVAANIGAPAAVIAGGGGGGIMSSFVVRASGEAWTNEDVSALYQQAHLLIGDV